MSEILRFRVGCSSGLFDTFQDLPGTADHLFLIRLKGVTIPVCELVLSNNHPCFPCNIAITIFLVLHMCEMKCHNNSKAKVQQEGHDGHGVSHLSFPDCVV